jgi:hypothetical protein
MLHRTRFLRRQGCLEVSDTQLNSEQHAEQAIEITEATTSKVWDSPDDLYDLHRNDSASAEAWEKISTRMPTDSHLSMVRLTLLWHRFRLDRQAARERTTTLRVDRW